MNLWKIRKNGVVIAKNQQIDTGKSCFNFCGIMEKEKSKVKIVENYVENVENIVKF